MPHFKNEVAPCYYGDEHPVNRDNLPLAENSKHSVALFFIRNKVGGAAEAIMEYIYKHFRSVLLDSE